MKVAEGILVQLFQIPVSEVVTQLTKTLQENGAKIYLIINQQKELEEAGITIPPMRLMVFGKPSAGGKIIKEKPLVGLDLPLKLLVWEDNNGKVWVAYNDTAFLRGRFCLNAAQSNLLDVKQLVTKAASNV